MPSVETSAVRRGAVLAALTTACVALAGCGGNDLELNGKVFNAIGSLTGSGGGSQEVKLDARPGLVQPPNLQNLPAPGSSKAPDGQLADIHDDDATRKAGVDKSALKAQQDVYCKEHYDVPKAHGDETTADAAVGPMGPCRKSALGLLGDQNPIGWINNK